MAAPTAPTLATIVAEGLKKAGYSDPASALTDRAEDWWMEEIKDDFDNMIGDLFQARNINVQKIVDGQTLIALPSDCSKIESVSMMSGQSSWQGVCSAGGTTTQAVIANSDLGTAEAIGKELVIWLTATPATAYSGCITGYDGTTATVNPAWSPSPGTTYSYMVSDTVDQIEGEMWTTLVEKENVINRGTPEKYAMFTLGGTRYIRLWPVPYFSDGYARALQIYYYSSLGELDLSGTPITSLYSDFRNVWVQGVFAKALQDADDERYPNEVAEYRRMMQRAAQKFRHGVSVHHLQMTVDTHN